MGVPVADLLLLVVMGAIPAGIGLAMLRKPLGRLDRGFWAALGLGVFVLSVLTVVGIVWALETAESQAANCPVEAEGSCGMAGMFVPVVAIGGVFSMLIFSAGAGAMQVLQRRRRAASVLSE